MGKIIKKSKKSIAVVIFLILIVDTVIGYTLLKSRLFSHLAIWSILESDKPQDFYWPPENAPAYFHFEPDSDRISGFRKELIHLTGNTGDELKTILSTAKYVMDISSNNIRGNLPLRWDSPAGMLKQVKQGAMPNCFHRAVLFSTYLSSAGIKSRLWTLENDDFNNIAHSINEVYVKALKKWVFIDVTFRFYVSEDGIPLSFLEFRERLLSGNSDKILFQGIHNEIEVGNSVLTIYRRLIKCVFLRANNDFAAGYNHRYGIFNFARDYIDEFPDNIRRGFDYLLSKQKFIHYADGFNGSLRREIILSKLFLYFFMVSSVAVGIFVMPFSHKHTRQR